MKKGMIFNWINNDFNKKGRYVVKEDFEKFSEMNFLDEKLEPEDKSFVKKLFYAMKKNEFYAGSYDLLGLISGGSAGVGIAIKQAVDFMYNETLMSAPMGDIDLFNGIAMGAIACLGVASAYNGVKGLIYKDNAKNYRQQIDEIVDYNDGDVADDESIVGDNIVDFVAYRESLTSDDEKEF